MSNRVSELHLPFCVWYFPLASRNYRQKGKDQFSLLRKNSSYHKIFPLKIGTTCVTSWCFVNSTSSAPVVRKRRGTTAVERIAVAKGTVMAAAVNIGLST